MPGDYGRWLADPRSADDLPLSLKARRGVSDHEEIGGPYLQIAVFCELVIEGKDGVLSLIRIIDRTTVTASGPNAPEKMPPTPINAWLVLSFKAGFAKGSYPVKIKPSDPDGKPLPEVTVPMQLEEDDRGQNIVLQVNMVAEREGLYWFAIVLGDRLVTRIPFRLVYQQISIRG